jgi:acyl-CoA hydrolase
VLASGNMATPRHLLGLLDATVGEYRLNVLNAQGHMPTREGVVLETPFVGPGMRAATNLSYVPTRLSLVPRLLEVLSPDLVLVNTSPEQGGRVSLGIEVNIVPAAIEGARRHGGLVVAQVNRCMPYTRGDGEIDCTLVDLAVEIDEELGTHQSVAPSEVMREVGARVAPLVAEQATLQVGIGEVPDATLQFLTGAHRIRVWSEAGGDHVLDLERAGLLDATTPIVASFLLGSRELYDWAGKSERLLMRRTEVVNDPAVIARKPAMTSLNSALQVDLFDQANASYVGGQIYSGLGGQPDFVVGAVHSDGGKAIIALASWHEKSASSSIVPLLTSPVTSFQHSAIVTENGSAEMLGRSQLQQANALVTEAAHPDARDELTEAAGRLGICVSP